MVLGWCIEKIHENQQEQVERQKTREAQRGLDRVRGKRIIMKCARKGGGTALWQPGLVYAKNERKVWCNKLCAPFFFCADMCE